MRRVAVCGTLVVLVLASRHASAQRVGTRGGDSGQQQAGHSHGDQQRHGHQHGGQHHGHHHHGHGRGQSGFWWDVGFPWAGSGGWSPIVWSPFPSYAFGSYTVFGFGASVPPVTVVNVNLAPADPGVQAAAAAAPIPHDPPLDPAPSKPRTTNAERKARAGRYIGFGDAHFGKQKYLAALDRYKTAVSSAPDIAESYFRQGFAQVAMGQYAKAAEAFRRGLRIRSNWNGSPFRLDQLYGGAPLAKTLHIENLAKAVEENPFDADLLLVLGMQSFFDGQNDRARVFFAGSAQLGGNEDGLLDDFLPKAGGKDPQPAGGKIVF